MYSYTEEKEWSCRMYWIRLIWFGFKSVQCTDTPELTHLFDFDSEGPHASNVK